MKQKAECDGSLFSWIRVRFKWDHKFKRKRHRLFYEIIKRGVGFYLFIYFFFEALLDWLIESSCVVPLVVLSPPRLQHPSRFCVTHKTLSARPRNFLSLFHHIPPSLGAAGVRGHRDAHLRISQTLGERGAGLPSVVGVGFCFLSISRTISALQGEISPITESRKWILSGSMDRKSAKEPASNLHPHLSCCAFVDYVDIVAPRRLNWIVFRDQTITARSHRHLQILGILPVNICLAVSGPEGSVRKLWIGLWCSDLMGSFC